MTMINELTFVFFRLPVVQGGTFTFVLPITALMSLERWACPGKPNSINRFQQLKATLCDLQKKSIYHPPSA